MVYEGIRSFETANVSDDGKSLRVNYLSVSTVNWVVPTDEDRFLPLNSISASIIREQMMLGNEVHIDKNWKEKGNEVLPVSVTYNSVTDLTGYKRRAVSFIRQWINPMMAAANASTIYSFNVINNKFLEAGFVFSESNKGLKFIQVLDKSDELNETDPEAGEELLQLLEKYISYKDILDRTYFIWETHERCITNILGVVVAPFPPGEDDKTDKYIQMAKEKIDKLVEEFTTKISTLNNTITR